MSSRIARVCLAGSLLATAAAARPVDLQPGPAALPSTAADDVATRVFASAEGLPQLTVLAIEEDADGYLWVGTAGGLARYDGRRFAAAPLPPALQRQPVQRLLRADDGRLWLAGADIGLHWFRSGSTQAPEGADAVGRVVALAPAREGGVIWIGGERGLARCTPQRCTPLPDSGDLSVHVLLAEVLDGREVLWVGSDLDGLYRYARGDDGQWQRDDWHLGVDDGLPNGAVRGLARFGGDDEPAALWVVTGRGVARWHDDRLQTYARAQGIGDGIPIAASLGFDSAGQGRPVLLVATLGAGLLEFQRADRWRVIGAAQGLPDPNLLAVASFGSGREAVTWLGSTDSGLIRLEPGRVQVQDERHGLPQRPWTHVGALRFPDGSEGVWASANGGSARRGDDGRWQPWLPAPYADWPVLAAVADDRGGHWFGTHRGLLQRHADGRWQLHTSDGSALPAVRVTQLAWQPAPAPQLWIGTNHGLATWRHGRIEALPATAGEFRRTGINALRVAPLGGVAPVALAATRFGLHRLDRMPPQAVAADCVRGREVTALATLGDHLWLATRDAVLRIALAQPEQDCEALIEPPGGAGGASAIAADRQGRVHLFGYDGIRRLRHPARSLADPEGTGWERLDLADGLPSLGFGRSAALGADGRLYVANAAGVVVLDDRAPAPAPARARLHLRVSVGDRDHAEDPLVVPAGHDALHFSYDLLSFRREQRIAYRPRLLGVDAAATTFESTAERRYGTLPPGHYHFELTARDADGREHGPVRRSVIVTAPWWQQAPMLAALMAGVLAAGLLFGRWRTRALAQRARRLEALVGERTAALAAANRELLRASATDPLTGAGNRRHFYDHVGAWLADSAGQGGLWLLLVDIDHFKAINDRHGHAIGDAVLVEVARRLRALDPDDAEVVRWGGEEFLLVRRQAAARDAAGLARSVLAAVAKAPIATGEVTLSVTCSIGITRCRPPAHEVAAVIDAIVARADQALYRAKTAGRNGAWEAAAGGQDDHGSEFRPLATGPEVA